MTARVFEGDIRIDAVPTHSRGLAYGDGLFETMRVCGGQIAWWDSHWSRLASGAGRLGIPLPDQVLVRRESDALFDDAGDGVLKLLLCRGGEARGYAPIRGAPPLWALSRHALPAPIRHGLRLHWCDTRASIQPALAGLKHCNRLEQVLARDECMRARADEGLMCDLEGHVAGATSANVFALIDGRWHTPPVDRCGVAGICRSHLLPLLGAGEMRLRPEDIEHAEAVFLCNAVRGILPVEELGSRTWRDHSASRDCQRLLRQAHYGLSPDLEHS
jgi:4-amino-4-deoxychorismate lyase